MRPLAAIALAALAACGDDLPRAGLAPRAPLTLLSYNLANIEGGPAAEAAAAAIRAAAPDLVALQECRGCAAWLAAAGVDLTVIEARAGVALGYRPGRWAVRDTGILSLGDNDDGWGERVAAWALLSPGGDQSVTLYGTHFCVTLRSPDDGCTVDRQLEYAGALVAHMAERAPDLPVLLAGDLNVFDGFEEGPVIRYLEEEAGLTDLFRAAWPEADGTTFTGNDWAPAGRVDYLFASPPVEVLAAAVDPVEAASDHYPVAATVSYPAER